MKALVIEDDRAAATAIELILTAENFDVHSTDLGEEGLSLGRTLPFDIIILDLNLPDMHGYDLLTRLRADGVKTPVLILSGIANLHATVTCLAIGADEYMTKPYQAEELVARIHAVLRRSQTPPSNVILCGGLAIDIDTQTANFGGTLIPFTGSEYALLECLALRMGTIITKRMLMNRLYHGMDEPDAKIIEAFMSKLRKKLTEACGTADCIETVWGSSGYRMRAFAEQAIAA